jgi:hypothetical protein
MVLVTVIVAFGVGYSSFVRHWQARMQARYGQLHAGMEKAEVVAILDGPGARISERKSWWGEPGWGVIQIEFDEDGRLKEKHYLRMPRLWVE